MKIVLLEENAKRIFALSFGLKKTEIFNKILLLFVLGSTVKGEEVFLICFSFSLSFSLSWRALVLCEDLLVLLIGPSSLSFLLPPPPPSSCLLGMKSTSLIHSSLSRRGEKKSLLILSKKKSSWDKKQHSKRVFFSSLCL